MADKFTFQIERQGDWFLGSCPEVPGANGQGRTLMSCARNLVQAIAVALEEETESTSATVEIESAVGRAHYAVEVIESLEGFSVSCPELRGCFSQGDDLEEALENIKSAIKDYLEVAEEMKQNASLTRVA